jgi:amino acid transporter
LSVKSESVDAGHAEPTELRPGAVALWGDVVAAVTNVAPSTAIALTLGALIGVAGHAGPFIMIVVGVAMLCIAIAYHQLNLWQPSAAAQAMWAARTVRPTLGLAVGLMVMIESMVSNIANIVVFGPYLLGVVWPSQAANPILQWVCSAVATVAVVAIAIAGVKAAIRFQIYLVWLEYAIILVFAGALLYAEFTGLKGSQIPSLGWLLPSASPSLGGLVGGIVLAVFMFGGWESAVYLAEEQHEAHRDPGRAGIISVIFCTIWFAFMISVIQAIAPAADLVKNSANVIAYAAGLVLPGPLAALVSLAVLMSVVGVVQSQLQVFSRVGYGLSREGLLPKALTRLSQSQTPWVGLSVASVLPIVLLVIYLANGTVAQALNLVTATAGILYIALYVAGALACTWYYRDILTRSIQSLAYAGILPSIGVLVLLFALVAAIPTTPLGTLIPAAVFVLVGLPVAWFVRRSSHAAFFDIKPEVATEEPSAAAAGR